MSYQLPGKFICNSSIFALVSGPNSKRSGNCNKSSQYQLMGRILSIVAAQYRAPRFNRNFGA